MSELDIELGKTYVTNSFGNKPWLQLYTDDLVQIVGVVHEDTVEYDAGLRFFSHVGEFYHCSGISEHKHPNLSIQRLVTADDLRAGDVTTIRTDLTFSTNPRHIPVESSDFAMILGGLYIDRMGFSHLVKRLIRLERPDGPYMYFVSDKNTVNEMNGSANERGGKSMRDFVYQIKID